MRQLLAEELLPAVTGAVVGPCVVGREAVLIDVEARAGAGWREGPGDDGIEAATNPGQLETLGRGRLEDLAVDDAVPIGSWRWRLELALAARPGDDIGRHQPA